MNKISVSSSSPSGHVFSFEPALQVRISKNGFTDHPLLSHIQQNLYVGMSPYYYPEYGVAADAHRDFNTIFNFFYFPRYSYSLAHDKQEMVCYRCFDTHGHEAGISAQDVRKYGQWIKRALDFGKPVLVHCQMGINRSNLFAAAALCESGMAVKDAIKLLCEKRSPYVLLNYDFRQLLGRCYGNDR